MPTQDQLYQALRNADAAGDTEGARKLAAYIQTSAQVPAPAAASAPQSAGAAQGQRIMAAVDQTNHESGKLFSGLGEAALNTVTGMASASAGGWRAMAKLATGGSLEDAAQAARDTQRDYTYEPRSGVGKLATEALALPLNIASSAASSIGGDIGQYVNGDRGRLAGESIGEELPAVAATLAGGRGALRAAGAAAATADAPARQPVAPAPPPTAPAPLLDGSRGALEAAKANAVQRASGGVAPSSIDLTPHVTNKPFMDALSPQDHADLLDSYNMSRHPEAAQGVRNFASQTGAEIVGRNLAGQAEAAAPPPPAAASAGASLADTSDISATLKAFGIDDPAAAPPAPAAAVPPGAPVVGPEALPAAALDADVAPATDAHARNLQVLQDVGLERIRKSAIEGHEANGATDYQLGKYTSEPAGMAAFDQFNAEREALAHYTQGMIDRTGAISGVDEQSLHAKGQAIAAPYDAARTYFEQAKTNLYNIANERAEATGKPVGTKQVDTLLEDPDFKATLMAQDQQGLLNTIKGQYDRFQALDPNGLSVVNAEKYRQWLNKVWSPANSKTLGQVKAALDSDVFTAAGDDVYAAGRQMHQLEKATLDDPKGISKLMDADPYTPINRATPYDKIPDKILSLAPDQFQHIVDTYRSLPAELQPAAQEAINTIKAHFGDQLLQAGTQTSHGNPRPLWNSGGINTIMRNNSAKLPMIFTAPEEMAVIRNIVDAGNLLRVNPSYPGSSAQAANAMQRGAMSKLTGKAVTGAGALAGTMVAGPLGGAAGAAGGAMLGDRVSGYLGERRALEDWKSRTIDGLSAQPGPRPVDPLEGY